MPHLSILILQSEIYQLLSSSAPVLSPKNRNRVKPHNKSYSKHPIGIYVEITQNILQQHCK